jgi:hypothetical protein
MALSISLKPPGFMTLYFGNVGSHLVPCLAD